MHSKGRGTYFFPKEERLTEHALLVIFKVRYSTIIQSLSPLVFIHVCSIAKCEIIKRQGKEEKSKAKEVYLWLFCKKKIEFQMSSMSY